MSKLITKSVDSYLISKTEQLLLTYVTSLLSTDWAVYVHPRELHSGWQLMLHFRVLDKNTLQSKIVTFWRATLLLQTQQTVNNFIHISTIDAAV